MLLEGGQELRPKRFGTITDNNTVQQVGIKYYTYNTASSYQWLSAKLTFVHDPVMCTVYQLYHQGVASPRYL